MNTTMPSADEHHLPATPSSPHYLAVDKKNNKFLAWNILERWLKHIDQDAMFWWTETGSILGGMMALAGYDQDSQQRNLLFYYMYIAPALGRRPTPQGEPVGWKSFMTDDYTPLELSWEWGRPSSGGKPLIRFSVEPIGREAGTAADILNQDMTFQLIDQVRPALIGNLDLTLFAQFKNDLIITGQDLTMLTRGWKGLGGGDHRSQMFLAFDLDGARPILKAYFLPGLKSNVLGIEVPELVSRAVGNCSPFLGPQFKSVFRRLQEAMEVYSTTNPLRIEIIGIDCITPLKSRVKIYVRCRHTSFDSVLRMLALGSKAPLKATNIAELRELWTLVLGLHPEYPTDQELPVVNHRTSGILYYFELKPNTEEVVPKVYIPVRHYGQNDLAIAQGLTTYFERRGQEFAAGSYLKEISNVILHRALDSGLGLHTYISCAFKKTGISVTSYFNPEIYHPIRYCKEI